MDKPLKPRKPGFYAARDAWSKAYMLKVLQKHKGNQSHAAKALQISRRCFLYSVEAFGIPQPGAGRFSTPEQRDAYLARIDAALLEGVDHFAEYIALFQPKPTTPTLGPTYGTGVEDGKALARDEMARLASTIAVLRKQVAELEAMSPTGRRLAAMDRLQAATARAWENESPAPLSTSLLVEAKLPSWDQSDGVPEHATAAEYLAAHPPSNRCPAPPEAHTSVSTCCDGAPLFLRPVSGISREEVQAMHDERIKEAFAKLGPSS